MIEKTTDEHALSSHWQRYREQCCTENRNQLIEDYLPLVKIVAGRLSMHFPNYIDKEDFINNGIFGLVQAIERYDAEKGVKFETFATLRIRGAMLDAIRAQDWLPVSVRQKARQIQAAVQKLEGEFGRAASDEEIAASLGIAVGELQQLLGQIQAATLVPLEEFTTSERADTANGIASPSAAIEQESVRQTLAEAIDTLPDKERLVVSLYYYEELTLKEISVLMNLSEARISQLHTKAVLRLRGGLDQHRQSLL